MASPSNKGVQPDTQFILRCCDENLAQELRSAVFDQMPQQQQHNQEAATSKQTLETLESYNNVEISVDKDDARSDELATYYVLAIGEHKYPVMLVNLPCVTETYKTYDHLTYFKGGDIGQAFLVFRSKERETAFRENAGKLPGTDYYAHGITPPAHNIVRNRFQKTALRRSKEYYEPEEVARAEDELVKFEKTNKAEDITEDIYEEVVDFEDYMVDEEHPEGITVTGDSALIDQYPSIIDMTEEPPPTEEELRIAEEEAREMEGDEIDAKRMSLQRNRSDSGASEQDFPIRPPKVSQTQSSSSRPQAVIPKKTPKATPTTHSAANGKAAAAPTQTPVRAPAVVAVTQPTPTYSTTSTATNRAEPKGARELKLEDKLKELGDKTEELKVVTKKWSDAKAPLLKDRFAKQKEQCEQHLQQIQDEVTALRTGIAQGKK